MPKMILKSTFTTKSESEKVYIEGYANKAIVDDAGDFIPQKAWDLTRFKKNPVVFFNHNPDYVIGMCEEVEAKEDGLYCRIALSESTHDKIAYVRDMVKEGILKTFSVGFMAGDVERSEEKNVINKAKLHEISIVSIPMNEDSIFSKKALDVQSWKSYDHAANLVLKANGAEYAAELHEQIADILEEPKEGLTRDTIIDAILDETQITMDALTEILAGNEMPTEEVAQAIATALAKFATVPEPESDEPEPELEPVEAACGDKDEDKEKGLHKNFDENPYLELARQNLVMLGVIADKLDKLTEQLVGKVVEVKPAQEQQQEPIQEEAPAQVENDSQEKQAELETLKNVFDTIEGALNKFLR